MKVTSTLATVTASVRAPVSLSPEGLRNTVYSPVFTAAGSGMPYFGSRPSRKVSIISLVRLKSLA